MSTGMASLQPTYLGHVATTRDALILFEACLSGQRLHVPRRPHDRERAQLIRSGCVFIYEENASGIKRWTDGVPWSPSRILGNFLVYRELLKPFPPGEKKRATKRTKRTAKPGEPYPRSSGAAGDTGSFGSLGLSPPISPPPGVPRPMPTTTTNVITDDDAAAASMTNPVDATATNSNTTTTTSGDSSPAVMTTTMMTTTTTTTTTTVPASTPSSTRTAGMMMMTAPIPAPTAFKAGETTFDREVERSLIGSLVDSYGFREGGLVKKTMSVHVNGVHHHLVSYYNVEDVLNRRLIAPSQHESLRGIKPRPELTLRQNFRAPLDELDEGFEPGMDSHRNPYDYDDRTVGGMLDRRLLECPPHPYPPGPVASSPHHPHASAGHGMPYHDHLPYAPAAPPHHRSAPHAPYGLSRAPHPPGAPVPSPTVTQSYYGAPAVSGPSPIKTEDYGPYRPPPSYSARYDALHHDLDASSAPTASATSERASPHGPHIPYPSDPGRSRPLNGVEPSSGLESKGPTDAYPHAYGAATSRPEHQPPTYAIPPDPSRWGPPLHGGGGRMENPMAGYPPSERGQFWSMTGGPSTTQQPYTTPPSVPHWNHPTA